MESQGGRFALTTPPTTDINLWRTTPKAVFQTMWPCCPLTRPDGVMVHRPSYVPSVCTGAAGTLLAPCFYNRVIKTPNPSEYRKFCLDRCLFEFVNAHVYLGLTDRRLLGWYLHLSPEDRKIIQDGGGLHQFMQRHSALELSRHHVSVRHKTGNYSSVQPTVTSDKHKSKISGAKTCTCGMPHTYLEQGKLVNNGTDNFIMPGCRNSRDGPQLREELCQNFHTAPNSPRTQEPAYHNAHRGLPLSQLNKESSAWQVASSAAVCRDPAALASFCPDMELERCRQEERGNPELTSYRSERPYTGNKSPPEYCSFYSTHMVATEYNDRSDVQSESDLLDCTFSPVEMSNTKEGCQDDMVYANEHTVYNAEASLSLEDESDNFHSIMEDDKSILVCLPSNGVKAHNSEIQSGPVTTDGETLAAKMNTAEKYTSPMSCVPVCDIMVGTELVPCASVSTQTDDPETVDKHIVTEVHMADLDYLTGELIKLKKVQEELREKEKMKSSGCRLRKGCDCVQRAQRAELCLLALQYSMCRQHCWRLYYASAEADQLTPVCGDAYQNRPMDHPANMLSVLKKLDSDYNGMREKILQGVPLEHLNPLSVDSWKITIAASYIPAQIIGDVRGSVSSWSSKEPQKDRTEKSSGCPDNESTKGCQRKAKQAKENSDPRRAVTCVPQAAACKELDISEVWYDAVEDVEPERAETGPDLNVRTYERTTDQDKTSALCVSSVPSNAMELITCSPSIKNRKMVCISPTAKGTCVPQHYGTMGGFDTLMAELTKHHPDVGRQRIVDALVELRAKHHGILSSLPLRTIREMMSELLTRQASSSQL